MKKIFAFFLCFVVIVALFSFNKNGREFSFEQYLTELSQVADDRPGMPSSERVDEVLAEFGEYEESTSGILKALKTIWSVIKLIYNCLVFAVEFLIYIVKYMIFLSEFMTVATYKLFVW